MKTNIVIDSILNIIYNIENIIEIESILKIIGEDEEEISNKLYSKIINEKINEKEFSQVQINEEIALINSIIGFILPDPALQYELSEEIEKLILEFKSKYEFIDENK